MLSIGLLDFLIGASPWWWVTLGLALIVLEMATMSFFLIWPGLAALSIALFLYISPDLSGEAQVALYAGLSILFTWIGRMIIRRTGQPETDKPTLNRRSSRLVGRNATAVSAFRAGEGTVEIDGVRWNARAGPEELKKGAEVTIVGADGMTLRVEPSEQG